MPPVVSEEYKEKKKKQILDSALSCFAEKGFQVATMDDIVKHSGISKGAIYNYFKSKDEIYMELMNEKSNQSFEMLKEKLEKIDSAKKRLEHVFEVFQSQVKVNPDWENTSRVHLEFWLSSVRNEQTKYYMLDRYENVYKKVIKDIVKYGMDKGEFSADTDMDFVGTVFWSFLDGVCLYQCALEDDDLYERLLKQLEKVVTSMVYKPKET